MRPPAASHDASVRRLRVNIMIIHYYDKYDYYYLSSEERNDLTLENAQTGHLMPGCSTHLTPPLQDCLTGEIPVFKNGEWVIVKDNFWRPTVEEINYDAGRSMKSFQFIDLSYDDFPEYPSLPKLCNRFSVTMRIIQNIRVINKRFLQAINLHQELIQSNLGCTLDSPNKGSLALLPSEHHELKLDFESMIFLMRRTIDSLVQMTDLICNYERINKNKIIEIDSIGSLNNDKHKDSEVKKVIYGCDSYDNDFTKFLWTTNNLFNALKHSLIHDESFSIYCPDFPVITAYSSNRSNHKKTILYHNHNAYHIMMGFQDCVFRIIKNQKKLILNLERA